MEVVKQKVPGFPVVEDGQRVVVASDAAGVSGIFNLKFKH